MWGQRKDNGPGCYRACQASTAYLVESGHMLVSLAVKLPFELCVRYWRRSLQGLSTLAVKTALHASDESNVAHMLTLFDHQVAEHVGK